MVICIDFDGTIVKHKYPEIGEPVPYALETLRELQSRYSLILYTMRSGKELYEAEMYLRQAGIVPWGININPTQHKWTTSPKAYAHYYIDDAAIGCPLVTPEDERPYVDWIKLKVILKQKKLL